MISQFERVVGAITLLTLGLTIFFSREVATSTTSWIETQYGFTQLSFSALAVLCGLLMVAHKPTRSLYVVLVLPYTLYWISNIMFVYNRHAAATVPGLLTCLWIVLYAPTIIELGHRRAFRE